MWDEMKMVTYLSVIFLATFSTAKAASERIIGGKNALIQSYPYQISLEYLGKHICGGSIITQYHVITAAHCEKPANFLRVRAGTSSRGQGGSLHQVLKFIPHEKYYSKWAGVLVNDIAIIKVKEPFNFDETRRPINLFPAGKWAIPRTNGVITGYGKISKGTLPKQLQVTTVPIVGKILCNLIYFLKGGLPKGEICAGNIGVIGRDSCQGDSGGPLAINNQLAGIVSWGQGCAIPLFPGAYTEIAYYRNWIDIHLLF